MVVANISNNILVEWPKETIQCAVPRNIMVTLLKKFLYKYEYIIWINVAYELKDTVFAD